MSADYRTYIGSVEFVNDREYDGKPTREVVVKTGQISIRATLYEQHKAVKVSPGDFIIVKGKYKESKGQNREGEGVTYRNINVNSLAIIPSIAGEKDSEAF